MHKKRILSLLMAGAMFMVSPVAAFGANLDVYEEDDPKHGDPNSDDTSLKSVTIYGGEVDIDGSDITVKYRLTDYPSESDIFIKVTDDDKTYEDWRMESTYWVRVNIVDEHYAEVEDLIRQGQVDCGFLGLPAGEGLEVFPLRRDQFMAVLPPDHPLAHAPFYPMERLAQDPFIWIPEDRDVEIGQIFQEEGIHPNLRYTVNDDFAILAMVEQGLGISIRPELVLRDTGRTFSAIPLERPRFRDIGLAVRRGRPLSPLTARFLDAVRQWTAGA